MSFGAGARVIQPDPVITNVMQDNSTVGGWLFPHLCSNKPVGKDFVRWSKQDSKSLLQSFEKTLRAPGSRANLLPRPIKDFVTSSIVEDAVRVEYTEEDVANSISPEEPRLNCGMKVLNVLQYALESRVAALYDPATFAAANKVAAVGLWAGATSKIVLEVESAKVSVRKRSGRKPNFIRIPGEKWPGILASDEIQKNPSGVFNEILMGAIAGGAPPTFLGLRLFVGDARRDSTYTGSLTPTFVWDTGTLANTVHIGYSATLDGQDWNGDDQTFVGQFSNPRFGADFEGHEYLDPNYEETLAHIVFGRARRSDPEVVNPECCFAITGI